MLKVKIVLLRIEVKERRFTNLVSRRGSAKEEVFWETKIFLGVNLSQWEMIIIPPCILLMLMMRPRLWWSSRGTTVGTEKCTLILLSIQKLKITFVCSIVRITFSFFLVTQKVLLYDFNTNYIYFQPKINCKLHWFYK